MAAGFTDEEYKAFIARLEIEGLHRAPVSPADVESNTNDESKTTHVDKAVCPRVRIRVHSKRRRLVDPDGVSAKWAIDGLVQGGLLADDSANHIESVTFTQELAEVEETVITVEEV